MPRIDRCICTNNSFEQLVTLAHKHDLDADDLGEMCGAGEGCGLCKPYLRVACRTGQTVFHGLIVAESDEQRLVEQWLDGEDE